jgi:hypothetical protein
MKTAALPTNHAPLAGGFLAGLALALLAAAGPARADGGFVHPYLHDVYEPTQKALLVYDAEAQREDLVIQASFEGDAEDFGWIIPVPARPEIDTADNILFFECADLTSPVVRRRGTSGCFGGQEEVLSPGEGGRDNGLVIYDDQVVGIYRALTLGAENAGALTDSLSAWGYLHADNQEAAEAALQFYVDKSWYFVALRVDAASARHEAKIPWSGGIDPIHLSFTSPEIVYPLRISAISAAYNTEVLIYAVADHRLTFPGAGTEYANHLRGVELSFLVRQAPHLWRYLPGPCFLTKLRCFYTPEEMTDDIVLVQAANDVEYRLTIRTGMPVADGIMLGIALFLVAWPLRGRVRRRKP